MRIPHYWARSTAVDVDPDGQRVAFSYWRSSDVSVEDARESARQVALRVLRRWITEGWRDGLPPVEYGYDRQPLREEVIERLEDNHGNTFAAITQNSYGVLVLNTARVMFIDLDFAPVSALERLWHYFKRLTRPSAPSPEASREEVILARLNEFLEREPQAGVFLYRTFAGMRAVISHQLYDPDDKATIDLLESLGADPLYVRLCKSQGSFRARLSPKPWRCGHHANQTRWPRETKSSQKAFERWQSKYIQSQVGYATCRFRQALGSGNTHPEVARVLEIHDRTTKCHDLLPLA